MRTWESWYRNVKAVFYLRKIPQYHQYHMSSSSINTAKYYIAITCPQLKENEGTVEEKFNILRENKENQMRREKMWMN